VYWLLLSKPSKFSPTVIKNRINVVNFELTIDMTRQLDDELMLLYTMRGNKLEDFILVGNRTTES